MVVDTAPSTTVPSSSTPLPVEATPTPPASALPRIVHDLAGPPAAGGPPATAEATLGAVRALLSARELGNGDPVDISALSAIVAPGAVALAPVLVRSTGPEPVMRADQVLGWIEASGRVFNRLARDFGPEDLDTRTVSTQQALESSLRWSQSLAAAVQLMEPALRAPTGSSVATIPMEVHKAGLVALEEQKAALVAEVEEYKTKLDGSDAQLAQTSAELVELRDDYHRVERLLKESQDRVAILEAHLASSIGTRDEVADFLVDKFKSPTCSEPVLRHIVDACARRDAAIADQVALVAFAHPHVVIPIPAPAPQLPALPAPSAPVSIPAEGRSAPASAPVDEVEFEFGGASPEPADPDAEMSPTGTLGTRGSGQLVDSSQTKRARVSGSSASGASLAALSAAAEVVQSSTVTAHTGSVTVTPTDVVSPTEPASASQPGAPSSAATPRPVQGTGPGPTLFVPLTRPRATHAALFALPDFPATLDLAGRYLFLRGSTAYRSTLSVAAGATLRKVTYFKLVDTDLTFTGTEVMGLPPAQRTTMNGWALQPDSKGNTFGYPSWIVLRSQSAAVLKSYGSDFAMHYLHLVELLPWDKMWADRVTRLYVLDPSLLPANCETWLKSVLGWMYTHRQVLWERLNWVHMPKSTNIGDGQVSILARQRERLQEYLLKSWQGMLKLRPASWPKAFTPLFEMEPAFWSVPKLCCTWVPAIPAGGWGTTTSSSRVLYDQLETLYDEEPVRVQFGGGRSSRFIEQLNPTGEHALAMHHAIGASWDLPEPWNDPRHAPQDVTSFELGTPGPEFYDPSESPDVFAEWRQATSAVQEAIKLFDPDQHGLSAELRDRLLGKMPRVVVEMSKPVVDLTSGGGEHKSESDNESESGSSDEEKEDD